MSSHRPPLIWRLLPLLLLGTGTLTSCKQDLPTVNMSEQAHTPKKETASKPRLRVAIGALISPDSTRELYFDLVKLIGARLGMQTVITQRRTYAEINHLLETAAADLAFVCSGPFVRGQQAFGLELLAVPVVGGETTYRAHIIVGQSSTIRQVAQLEGKRFAYTDQHSNTGHLVPTHLISSMGKQPAAFFGETFFTNGHDNSIRAVAMGITDGAAVDSLIWDYMSAAEPTITSRARVIWTSGPFGIPPVVVRPGLSAGLKARLKRTFLALNTDVKAASMLDKLKVDRFAEGSLESYASVREMLQELSR